MSGRIVVPRAEVPRLTIAVVLYRGGRSAIETLRSVVGHTAAPFEVIVVDNASPDASGGLVRLRVTGATFVFNGENEGFGGGMNRAVRLARAEAVCLLNPDIEVGPGWEAPLLETLDREPACAAVSPVLLHPDGSVQEAGAWVDSTGHSHPFTTPPDGARAVEYASAACLVVRRSAFLDAGGFDPAYHPAYFEDVDLAFRWRRAGRSVWVEPRSSVIHTGGVTSVGGSALRLAATNLQTFRIRWADELASPGRPGRPDA